MHNLSFQPTYFKGLRLQNRLLSLFPCLPSQYMDYRMHKAFYIYIKLYDIWSLKIKDSSEITKAVSIKTNAKSKPISQNQGAC